VSDNHYRFHILGIPHTKTSKEFCCPFTQLTYNLCQMLFELGHEVYHYGAEGSDPPCTEHITVVTDDVQKQAYGENYGWRNFSEPRKAHDDLVYTTFRENTIRELNLRKQPRDMLLVIPGGYHSTTIKRVGMTTIEPAVGNKLPICRFKVFASYAWMHYKYGQYGAHNSEIFHGNWYDAVIPHYFNPRDFTFSDRKDNYYLFLGRVVRGRGPHIAAQVCQELGTTLLVAGGADQPSFLRNLRSKYSCVEYLGVVGPKERSSLLAKAKALMSPTLYIEPFGMPVVEALLSGTPVVTTDWGAFSETVKHGEVGYRCRTMSDFIWAADNVDKISPRACREYAVANYSMEKVSKAYQEYFMRVHDLHGKGWYAKHPDRGDLDWLRRY